MNILLIAPARVAGTLQYTHNLANALSHRGHQVALATAIDFETKSYSRAYRAIEVFDRYRPRPLRWLGLLYFLLSFRPQIVHMQGAQHPPIYLALWGLLSVCTSAKFVYSPQDVLPNTRRSYHTRILRALYRRMSHVFVNARQNRDEIIELFGVTPDAISVLPMADLTAFVREAAPVCAPQIAEERRLVLCFGLIEPRKGIHSLVSAFPAVLAKAPNAYLAIVGKPLLDVSPLVAEIQRLGIDDHVHLRAEYVSFAEMAGYFQRAEVVVLPYDTGWNSGVLASAFGFQKPVIATTVGGLDEVVQHGQNGILVPPRDPEALAAAIVRVLTEDRLRARLSEGVKTAATRYSWAEIARQTEKVYRSVGMTDQKTAS